MGPYPWNGNFSTWHCLIRQHMVKDKRKLNPLDVVAEMAGIPFLFFPVQIPSFFLKLNDVRCSIYSQ
jgi:hypothetical protein